MLFVLGTESKKCSLFISCKISTLFKKERVVSSSKNVLGFEDHRHIPLEVVVQYRKGCIIHSPGSVAQLLVS